MKPRPRLPQWLQSQPRHEIRWNGASWFAARVEGIEFGGLNDAVDVTHVTHGDLASALQLTLGEARPNDGIDRVKKSPLMAGCVSVRH